MKKSVFILVILAFIWGLTSCESNKIQNETDEKTGEVWTEGVTTISGTISSVTQEKDGQTIVLTNNKGITYTAVISIPNLRENASQYRKFEVGETVSFKGEFFKLGEENRMVVREVLEMR